jgi:peptidyl-prolyl cis-trans isomerase D
VSERIAATLRSRKALELIRERAHGLEERLRAGADFAIAAQESGAEVQQPATYARQSEEVDSRVLEAIFRTDKPADEQPTIGNAVTDDGDYAVFSVSAGIPGRPETIPLAERDAGKLRLAQESGAEDYTAFVLELERTADIVRSEDALAEPEF